ncbi:MAG: site-specific integrase [Actinomycetota bacterium]|jgi:integrase|nr:site-specific integrase [Actinomycetota bacterium]
MGRRGNSEGSIYAWKRGGKKIGYRGAYFVDTAEGPKRRYITGKTREDVAEKLAKAISDRDGGLVFDAGSLTAGEYLARWLSDSVRGTVRSSTYRSYGRVVNGHLVPGIGREKLAKLRPDHIRRLYRDMLDAGKSTRTVQYAHTLLKRALTQAVMDGLIPRNAAEAVKPPKLQREEIQPLNADQVWALLDASEEADDRLRTFYAVAVRTGMRPGEMLALRWSDVDLDANAGGNATARINRSLSDGEFTAPKTARSRRRITLSPATVAALKSHRKRQLEERMSKAGLWEDHDLVFPSSVGTPKSQRNLNREFKAAAKRAGLPEHFKLYDLRHTCATLLLSRNIHPKYVQELLGHASIALTLDTYSHVIPGMDGGTGGAIDEALG